MHLNCYLVLVVEEAGKPQINRYICLKREEASVVLIVFGYVLCEGSAYKHKCC